MSDASPPSIILARYWQERPDSIPHIDDVKMLRLDDATTTSGTLALRSHDLIDDAIPTEGLAFGLGGSSEQCVFEAGTWRVP